MIEPYVGEIRMFAGSFAPDGWLVCDGQLVSIAGSEALFALLGTTYGGDGVDTFAVPDLRGRTSIHQGSGFAVGQAGGAEEVALTASQLPSHRHSLAAVQAFGSTPNPGGSLLAETTGGARPYIDGSPGVGMAAAAIGGAGGGEAHPNVQPYLAINFIISLFGTDPTPS